MNRNFERLALISFFFLPLAIGCGPKANERVEQPEMTREQLIEMDKQYAKDNEAAREAMN